MARVRQPQRRCLKQPRHDQKLTGRPGHAQAHTVCSVFQCVYSFRIGCGDHSDHFGSPLAFCIHTDRQRDSSHSEQFCLPKCLSDMSFEWQQLILQPKLLPRSQTDSRWRERKRTNIVRHRNVRRAINQNLCSLKKKASQRRKRKRENATYTHRKTDRHRNRQL